MRYLALLLSITFLCLPASARAETAVRVVVFGDSLTAGYQLQQEETFSARLEAKIKNVGFENVEVIDMSVENESTAQAFSRMDSVLSKKPEVVLVALGLNDIQRGVSPHLIQYNLSNILSVLKKKNIYTVLVGVRPPAKHDSAYTKKLEGTYAELIKGYNPPFYPDALAGVSGNPKFTLADDYLPNAQGVDIMVEGMYGLVDTGLRWAYSVREYQEQYRKSLMPQDGSQ